MKIRFLLLLLFVSLSLWCHPHTFIDNSYQVYITGQGISKIEISWVFDEMFSESIFNDFDQNSNNIFEESERQLLYETAFINTGNYNYFLDLTIGGEKLIVKEVEDFTPSVYESKLIYTFTVVIPEEIETLDQQISILSYDPTYYIMVDTSLKTGLKIHNSTSCHCHSEIVETWIEFEMYGELPVNAVQLKITPN